MEYEVWTYMFVYVRGVDLFMCVCVVCACACSRAYMCIHKLMGQRSLIFCLALRPCTHQQKVSMCVQLTPLPYLCSCNFSHSLNAAVFVMLDVLTLP